MLPGIGNTLKKYLNEYQNAKSEREKGKVLKSGLDYSSKMSNKIKSELLPINITKYPKNNESNITKGMHQILKLEYQIFPLKGISKYLIVLQRQ